jgi:conjugative relaxase-like TrwC/TraI family protein
MLRVARVSDSTGRYYLAELASELEAGWPGIAGGRSGPSSAGRWLGAGAAGLALHGHVEAGPLSAVLSGRHPTEGHRLRLRETAVSAYDLTFAAPKSASVLFALGAPSAAGAVRDAHEEAVDAATAYVARHAAAVRRLDPGGRSASPVDGLVAASFTHHVSRALDPHLHSHVVVANVARGDDGRWRAIDGRGLYAHAQAAGALYDAVLRHGVTARLGLEWSPRRPRGWELSAVDPVLIGALSARRAEILAELDGHTRRAARTSGAVGPGWVDGMRTSPSGRARTVAWARTRDPKVSRQPFDELRTRWAAIAHDAGCPVELRTGVPTRRAARAEIDEHRFAAAIHETGHHGVARRDAVRAWAQALGTGAPAESIERCVVALVDWGEGIGVAEPLRAFATVTPRPHVLRVLGPRPASPEHLSVWMSAATSILRYRSHWEVRERWPVLGGGTQAELAAMPARRLAEHLSTSRAIDEALSALGRRGELERRRDGARGLVRDAT